MSQAKEIPVSEDARVKRAALTAAGGTLVALGLKRGTMPGYAAALAGGWLAYRGIRGGRGDRSFELVSLGAAEASAEAVDVERTLTVQASPEEVHAFLADAANLDVLFGEAGTVEARGEHGQRWTLATPLGGSLAWEMQPVTDHEGETGEEGALAGEPTAQGEARVIGWRSVEDDSGLRVDIAAEPTTEGEATELTLRVAFAPPGGAIGKAVLDRLDVVPHAIVGKSLRRAKSLIETGEMPALEPAGGHERSAVEAGSGRPAGAQG